jgi:hypothetical protein
MHEVKSEISTAIRNKHTLIFDHYYSEIIREPITLEVYPLKLDGDFLVCYDFQAEQPYAINLNSVIKMSRGEKTNFIIPVQYRI